MKSCPQTVTIGLISIKVANGKLIASSELFVNTVKNFVKLASKIVR